MQQQATFWSDVGTGMAWTSLIVYGWVCLAPVAFCLTRFLILVSCLSALTVGEQKWLLPAKGTGSRTLQATNVLNAQLSETS